MGIGNCAQNRNPRSHLCRLPSRTDSAIVFSERDERPHQFFFKARYCHSILATAANSDDEGARHLVDCLATESLTGGTSAQVATAEREAIQLIVHLADQIQSRTIASAIAEWRHASDAVLRWINAAG